MALEPGDHVLLKLRTGDYEARRGAGEALWRHAVILDRAEGVFHQVLSPTRAVRKVGFSDKNIVEILLWNGTKLPGRVSRKMCRLDTDTTQGRFTAFEVKEAIDRMAGIVLPTITVPAPKVHTRVTGKRTPEKSLPAKDGVPGARPAPPPGLDGEAAASEIEPRPLGATGEIKDGEGWYVFTGAGAALSSSLVQLKGTVHAVLGDLARFDKSGKTCVAVWSTAERVAEALLDLRIRASVPRSRGHLL